VDIVAAMPHGIVPISTFIEGYEQATHRFYDVMRETDPLATFIPLFDALGWAVAIDNRFQGAWEEARTNPAKLWSDGFIHGDTVKGVRFARNRVHHQWADALETMSGRSFPITFPVEFREWRWRAELPPGRNDEFKEHYDHEVASHPARATLGDLSECFADAARQGLTA
jgi:hypothetical protein